MYMGLTALSTPELLILIGVVGVLIILFLVALGVLIRTPKKRLRFGSHFPWLILIILLPLIGPLILLTMSRHPAGETRPTNRERQA